MNREQVQHQSVAASRALLVAALAGVLLLLAMFLKWFGPSDVAEQRNQVGPEQNAWEVFSKLDVILAFTALTGAGLALGVWAMARRRGVPGWPLLGGVLVGAIGTVGAALLLGRMIDAPGDDALQQILPGAYVGLLLTVALAAAGWTAALVGMNAVRRGYVIHMAPIVSTPASRQLGPGDSGSTGAAGSTPVPRR